MTDSSNPTADENEATHTSEPEARGASAPAEASSEAPAQPSGEAVAATEESTQEASPAASEEAPAAEEAPAPEASAQEAPQETTAQDAPADAPEVAPAEEPPAETAPVAEASEPARAADAQESPAEAPTDAAPQADAAPQESAASAETPAEAKPEEVTPAEPKAEPTLEEILEANPELREVAAAIEARTPVEGKVIGWNKGGFHVTLNGTPAFCPKSQIELGKPKKAASYIDRDLTFRILEIKDAGKRIVVSRSDILREERQALLENLHQAVKSGDPLEGRVSSITEFGAFVDLGGLEGLVHLSQLSRRRVETPRDVVNIGDQVKVKVTKIEKGGERISLSMKALEPDPWQGAADRYPTGGTFTGKILRKTDFGLFVELEDGLEGLVHTSQLPLGKKLEDSEYEIGNEITGWIRDTNPERRRLSLALREVAQTNPWKDIHERFSEGAEIEGQVEQVAKFGVFVMLEPGLTGLLPFSAMQRGPNSTARPPLPGQSIKVQIASIDSKKRRISLAPVGSKLEGTRADYQDYKKNTTTSDSGLGQMAAAFAKLKNG